MPLIQTSTGSILSSLASTAKTLTNHLSQMSNLTYNLAVSFTFQQPKFHPPFDMVKTAFTALGKHFLVKTAAGISEFTEVIAALNNGTCGADMNTTALNSSQYTKLVEWYDDSHEELADFYRSIADMPQEEVENCTKALIQTAVDLYNGPSSEGAYNPLFIELPLGLMIGVVGCLTILIIVKLYQAYQTHLQGYTQIPPAPAGFVGDDIAQAPAVVVAVAPAPATAPMTTAPAPSAQHESSSDSDFGSEASDDSYNNNNRSSTTNHWARFNANNNQASDGHDSDLDLDEYDDVEEQRVKLT